MTARHSFSSNKTDFYRQILLLNFTSSICFFFNCNETVHFCYLFRFLTCLHRPSHNQYVINNCWAHKTSFYLISKTHLTHDSSNVKMAKYFGFHFRTSKFKRQFYYRQSSQLSIEIIILCSQL